MKLHEEDKVFDFNEKIRKRIETLRKVFSDEMVLTRIAQSMIPHTQCQDEHGHSDHISFRIHPAQYAEIMELWESHNIKFQYRSDYFRYLITLGMIVDRYYWEMGKEIGEVLSSIIELQKEYSRIALQQQIRKIKDKADYIKKRGKEFVNEDIEEVLKKLEEI